LATYSQYLGLKLNASTDPFQLSDFIANWGILDASPGIFVCTSASRPSWSSGQAGRLIFMTDIKQLSWFDGTNWNDLRDSSPVFGAGSVVSTSISANASPTFGVCTFVTPRPCALTIIMTGTYWAPSNVQQRLNQVPLLDGVQQPYGGFTGDATTLFGSSSHEDYRTVTSLAIVPTVSAGTHTIGIQVNVLAITSAAINFRNVKCVGLVSLYSPSNSL
jgi:hypothetical protein